MSCRIIRTYPFESPLPATLVFIMIMMALGTLSGCKKQEVLTYWAASAIAVDGKSDDWEGIALTHFDDEQISLGLANDSSRLYLLMRTRDRQVVRSIRFTGLKLWLNADGDKESGFGITYRGGPGFRLPGDTADDSKRPHRNEIAGPMARMIADTTPRFTFINERRLIDLDIPVNGEMGPSIAVDTSHGFVTYEFSIPLGEGEVRYFGLGAEPGSEIAIGAIWGDVDREAMQEGMDERRGGFEGGPSMGGSPPGGMMGRPMGGPRGGFRQEMQKVEFWLKTILARQSTGI